MDAQLLRRKWTEKLNDIQSKDPSPGSGSFTSEGLRELSQVLRLTHSNFTKDEDDERKELLKLIERKLGSYYPGSLGWADLSSLRLICLIPDLPDHSLREELENEACLVDLEASSRKSRPFPATAVRRLKRVFERFDPVYQQNELYHEVKAALKKKDLTERWVLEAEAVRRCLKHLFPSAEDVKREKASSSGKKSARLDTETRPAKVATPKKQVVASKDHSASAPTIARRLATSPPRELRSAPSTASSSSRSRSMSQMNVEDLDPLLTSFITVHCSILPIFDLSDLKLLYRVVRTRGEDAPAPNLAILSLCFALASRAYDQRTTQNAMDFFNRGSSLLPALKASGDTMMLIQGHVLQTQYFFEKGDFDEATVAISSAICRAHSEGIHTKTGAYYPIPEKELHLRSRVWHAIQVSERTLALYRGVARPNFCSDCNAAFPKAPTISDDDQLQTTQIGYVAFNAWARLYQPVDILMDIEREFRIYEGGCQMHKIACNFKDYSEEYARLAEWKQSLSGRLKHVPNDTDSADVSRIRIIIHLRYLYYRLRLHRPFLILALSLSLKCTECPDNPRHLLDNSLETPLEFATIRDGFVKCLIATVELSRKLRQYTGQDSAGHYFQNASLTEHAEFAYACGLVLLAARMVPDMIKRCDSGITSLTTIQLTEASILALRKYGKADQNNRPLCTRITRCADALEAFSRAVGDVGPFGFISEGVGFPIKSWQKLYGRLKVDMPVRQSIPSSADSTMSFGWIESQTVDLDD